MTLRLDWCGRDAAEYACLRWHYSRAVPTGKAVRVGVWERGAFIGVVMFGRGGNNHLAGRFGLDQTEACELTRIALTDHETPVSRIGAIAVRMLRRQSPGLRLVVSYADPAEGHHGGVYQAMNWIYTGRSTPQRELLVEGRFMHKRSATSRWGTASPAKIRAMTGLRVEYGPLEWKHRYATAFDPETRERVRAMAQPYPKRGDASEGEESSRPATSGEEGGASPTPALHSAA